MTPLDAVGKTYRSFVVTRYLPLEELQCTLIEAVHEPSGAKIMHIASDDPENLFCLSLQTLPQSSNGVAHILEHTVLCGSEKFPIKDPFFSMTRRSLNTFMNAMTGQDFTCYPASSQVEKDFYNLLEVYLDAVFHPQLKKESFLQEGHRLEFAEPQNEKSPLQFQGVVFNEMKGVLTSVDSRLWESVMKHLTPDLPYALNSGGDPKEIPHLSYEELKEFHKTFYHPSRCLFFFYGNLPLAKHLDFLLKQELDRAEKLAPLPLLPKQRRFSSPQFVRERYPVAATESLEKKTLFAFSWLTAPLTDQQEVLALSLLDSLLMDTDVSPLKKALLKSGLCTHAESSYDTEMSEVPFSLLCKGCEEKDGDALRKVIFDALKTAEWTKEEIEASLHQLQFQRMEIGAEGIPFGLTLFFRAAPVKQHGGDTLDALLIHSLFEELRRRLDDPQFLAHLIEKYLLQNPHFVQLAFVPDPHLEQEEKAEEEKRLLAMRPHVDASALMAQSQKLASYQEEVESQSLNCLPHLSLKDVPPHARDFPLQEMNVGPLHIYAHPCFTNKIVYADLVYDLPHVPFDDLTLLSFFTRILTELGAGKRDYAENLAFQQAYTGEFSASLALHATQSDPNLCRPTLSLKAKALERNREKLFSLFVDTLQNPHFNDPARVQELLLQLLTSLQNRLTKNALTYAIQTSLSSFSSASFVYDQWHGLPFYEHLLEWAKNPKKLTEELVRIQEIVLGCGEPHLILSCEKGCLEDLQRASFYDLSARLPNRSFSSWRGDYPTPSPKPQARIIASPVAFNAEGFRTIACREKASPHLLLSTELFENVSLHHEIREKGGAYGSGASYAPTTGNFYFYSYRDPHLVRTHTAFQKAIEKIGGGHFTNKELEEAKFGTLQTLDAPVPPGQRAITAYSWKRAGRTLADREHFRQALLGATKQDVTLAVQQHIAPHSRLLVTYLGQELYNKEKKKLKLPLDVLPLPT